MRWTVGILLGFVAMLVANGMLVWYAVSDAPQIEPSYTAEPR